jgi:hypothetical protein
MKTRKWLFIIAIQYLTLAASSHADLFRGSITQTILNTNQPDQSVGDQVIGWYQYESGGIDGNFGTTQYCDFNDPSASATLEGSVFGFFGWTPDGWLPFTSTGIRSMTHLVVTGGMVTDFYATGQMGGGDYGFCFSDFSVSNLNMVADESYTTSGSLTFGTPTAVPEGMNSGTLILLVIAMGSAYFLRRTKMWA